MDEDIFCSAGNANDFCADDFFFEIAKIYRIFYRIFAGMEGAIIICPDIGYGEPSDMAIEAMDSRLYFG